MRRHIYAASFAALLCAGSAHAQQQTQTDYQRVMNSANNASSAAFGQPQPDPGAIDSAGNPTPNGNTSTSTGSNLPLANQSASTGYHQGYGSVLTGSTGTGMTTTSGSIGLGAYNSSPYNTAPTTGGNAYGGRGVSTPAFTGP